MKKFWVCLCTVLLAAGLTACSDDDDNGDDDPKPDTSVMDDADDGAADGDEMDETDDAEDTVADMADDTDDAAEDGDDGSDVDLAPGDIVVSPSAVMHQQGNEWALIDGTPWNNGESAITVAECTYEAHTVADETLITEGTFFEDTTIEPPGDGTPGDFASPVVEFEPSEGEETVDAEMTITCTAAEGEEEADTTNNSGSVQFDW